MEQQQIIDNVAKLLRAFPMFGTSGRRTLRVVDEDVFLDGLKQILEYKP